jgi:hypothetical protein
MPHSILEEPDIINNINTASNVEHTKITKDLEIFMSLNMVISKQLEYNKLEVDKPENDKNSKI